jgi:uncharacterized protein YhbP (UPF0306 family)
MTALLCPSLYFSDLAADILEPMDATALIKQYLERQHMMQLATVADGQPWICTVYYMTDDDYNLYWASLPTRRHSQEVASHPQVAVAIPVKFVKGEKVAGLQIEGRAETLPPSPALRPLAERYAAKFHRDVAWTEDFVTGRTAHRLYKLTPARFVLFDESNFPANPRHELSGSFR